MLKMCLFFRNRKVALYHIHSQKNIIVQNIFGDRYINQHRSIYQTLAQRTVTN